MSEVSVPVIYALGGMDGLEIWRKHKICTTPAKRTMKREKKEKKLDTTR